MKTQIKNLSGWKPVGHAVLLKAVELEAKSSAIHIPKAVAESSATGDLTGVVVEIGADCWTGPNETRRCEVGDTVVVTRYAGGILTGDDGKVYRMVPDHSVYARKVNGHE